MDQKVFSNTSKEDGQLINLITRRAMDNFGIKAGLVRLTVTLGLMAVHGTVGLRLKDFLEADSLDFAHDIIGIDKHLCRDSWILPDSFIPRFAIAI